MLALLLLGGMLAWQLVRFADLHSGAAAELAEAQRLAGAIMLADERLTMSALLAAGTADPAWAERYRATLPAIDEAIAGALAAASPQVRDDFDAATRLANDRLVQLETRAFAEVEAGRPAEAWRLLTSPEYTADKQLLATGTERFVAALVAERQAALDDLVDALNEHIALAILVTAFGFGLLWARLYRRLGLSAAAHERAIGEISRLAAHDTLTGLPNRRALGDALARAMSRADRSGGRLTVMMVDLDRFKPINDRLGHLAGDSVLVEVAKRLRAGVRDHEIVARMGGDEFVVLVEHGAGGEPKLVAERLVAAVTRPIDLGDQQVAVGSSIGLATYPDDSTVPENLLRMADVALYRAKSEGGGAVRRFDVSMDEAVRERESLEAELREAVRRGEIEPFFQPQVELSTNRIVAFEALARWRHPTRGILLPERFLPIAEEGGLMAALTIAVLERGMRAARAWPDDVRLAINLSPRQLGERDLGARIEGLLQASAFPPARLTIELTEDALVADLETARATLTRLKALGVRIELDDFGTGYSSVSHISELPIDGIKLDRRFAAGLADRPEQASVVAAVVALARGLGLSTTVEGIETSGTLSRARELGCDVVQGFVIAEAVDADAASDLVRAAATRDAPVDPGRHARAEPAGAGQRRVAGA